MPKNLGPTLTQNACVECSFFQVFFFTHLTDLIPPSPFYFVLVCLLCTSYFIKVLMIELKLNDACELGSNWAQNWQMTLIWSKTHAWRCKETNEWVNELLWIILIYIVTFKYFDYFSLLRLLCTFPINVPPFQFSNFAAEVDKHRTCGGTYWIFHNFFKKNKLF